VKFSATYRVPAPPDRVFAALQDPAVLCRCLEGCQQLTRQDDGTYEARLTVGLGSIKGSYAGKARMIDLQPPQAFTLSIDGKGAAGWVRGSARMQLSPDGAGTLVACDADGQVGGVIAAVGSRLIDAAARRLSDRFFEALAREL
jgi:hypothetical protein